MNAGNKVIFTGLLILQTLVLFSQKSYDVRFRLTSLDTIERTACFHIELRNSGRETWILSNYNIAIFYDTSAACFSTFFLALDDGIYDPSITNIETSAVGTPLPYESSLGFIRAGLSANSAGIVMDTFGTWVPTIRLCFDLKLSPITSPKTSFHVNFNSPVLQPIIGVPPNIVQEWNPNVFISDVALGEIFDNNPAPTLSSSFVVEENTTSLCTDGIDNDEDGLVDCNDTDGCSVGQPSINLTTPDCSGAPGRIRINGQGGDITYSLDGGNFVADSIFTDLPAGQYEVRARRFNLAVCEFVSPVLLEMSDCLESGDAICADGLDNDGDGDIDCDDTDCVPLIDMIEVRPADNCPILQNGTLMIQSLDVGSEVSIDSGLTYFSTFDFDALSPGSYHVLIRNPVTGCFSAYQGNPVILNADPGCIIQEICTDGVDNDGDGLIDCADEDCSDLVACQLVTSFYLPSALVPNGQTNNRFGLFTQRDEMVWIDRIVIFDRWGGLVYDISNLPSSDPSHRWDGRVNGDIVPSGVYVYLIKYNDNGVEKKAYGDLTIIN